MDRIEIYGQIMGTQSEHLENDRTINFIQFVQLIWDFIIIIITFNGLINQDTMSNLYFIEKFLNASEGAAHFPFNFLFRMCFNQSTRTMLRSTGDFHLSLL